MIHSHGGFGRLSSGSSSGVASGARSFRLFAGDDMTQWGEALESLALITVITSFLKCVYDAAVKTMRVSLSKFKKWIHFEHSPPRRLPPLKTSP